MCGITGILNLSGRGVSPAILQQMTDAIIHRGPDGEGFFTDGPIGLGHRRLAVIDLSPAAHQPMMTSDRQMVISYNGEVYNFRELRTELEKLGYQFCSKTDSEVVLNAYVHWGADCVKRFNGMFAFAIWNKTKNELFLARDRYGIKPLYYKFQNDLLVFGSEQKALFAHPEISKTLDFEALIEYFTFQNIFTAKTLLKGIQLFPAGSWAVVKLNDRSIKPVQYWDFDFEEPHNPQSEQDYLEELERLFVQAVNRQLISDVDVGSYLSGGIDSGSITAVAAQQNPFIKTFTCGFDMRSASGLELGCDEREKAEYMSYLFKTEHYEMVLKAGDMERILPALAYHLEEPRVGQSYPNYYIAKLASKFVKVVLSGAGGDELFAGYPWRYYRVLKSNDFEHYIDQYYQFWQRLLNYDELKMVFTPIWNQVSHVSTRDIFRDVFQHHRAEMMCAEDYINHSLYFEAKTFLHGLLNVEDKLSMAHGLETRLPFLDNDLVDFAMRVPVKFKLKNLSTVIHLNENEPAKTLRYYHENRDGKLLLRKVMSKYIPQEVIDGGKQGFSAPDASWFKGESIEYVRKTLLSDNARIYEFMNPLIVQKLVKEHLDGKQNRRLFIWSLLSFEMFLHVL